MNVLDLFSGIGGFSLGLERAGMKTIAFCEIEEFPRKVLRKHWPDVPIFRDVKELHAEDIKETVDVVCGGFPCQDLSFAGEKKGFDGERSSLYGEMLRIISECGPKYAIFENVSNLIVGNEGKWFAKFLYDLAACGYDAEWHCIPCDSIGAPHERDRVWIIAYTAGERLQESCLDIRQFTANYKVNARTWNGKRVAEPGILRVVDGVPDQMDSLKAYGNSVVPQIPEIIGRAILSIEKGNKHD